MISEVMKIYAGSDASATVALYTRLELLGISGKMAMNLFRAQKCSERAKVYRGSNARGSYRQQAYDRKTWSMEQLCIILSEQSELSWGWKEDGGQEFHKWVLYVDLPTGQVSFHTGTRGNGPDYAGEWDKSLHTSPSRIIRFCAEVLK